MSDKPASAVLFVDDEVNILEPGGNYGWPHVAGFRDDKAYQYARWPDATTPCAQLQFSEFGLEFLFLVAQLGRE